MSPPASNHPVIGQEAYSFFGADSLAHLDYLEHFPGQGYLKFNQPNWYHTV